MNVAQREVHEFSIFKHKKAIISRFKGVHHENKNMKNSFDSDLNWSSGEISWKSILVIFFVPTLVIGVFSTILGIMMILRVVQTQAIPFLKAMSERSGSDIEQL